MASRKPIPMKIQDRVFDRSRRRCALCVHFDGDYSQKHGQLAHLDRDRTNASEDNLAYLCLQHHDEYDTQRRQTKNLTLGEVKAARDRLYTLLDKGIPLTVNILNDTLQSHKFQIISTIYSDLHEACELLKHATRRGRLEDEAPPEEYLKRCDEKLIAAQTALARDRLLVPTHFISLCDRFFVKINEGAQNFAMALSPSVPDGLQRAGFWDKASMIAYEEVPPLLNQIEEMGRSEVHG